MKFSFKNIIFLLVLVVGFVLVASLFSGYGEETVDLTYSDVLQHFEKGEVYSFEVDTSRRALTTSDHCPLILKATVLGE